jgi:hypothetical protein
MANNKKQKNVPRLARITQDEEQITPTDKQKNNHLWRCNLGLKPLFAVTQS